MSKNNFKELVVLAAQLELDLHYSTTIIPLADMYSVTERRKDSSRRRLEEAWGDGWDDNLRNMLPPFPAETFLHKLTLFAEAIPWADAENLLKQRIKERLATLSRSRKCRWLVNNDLTEPHSTSIPTTAPTSEILNPATAPVLLRKRKKTGRPGGKRVFDLEIPVIILDVEERVGIVQQEAVVEMDKTKAKDKRWVSEVLKGLVRDCDDEEEERSSKEFCKRRVRALMEELMMQIVEKEED